MTTFLVFVVLLFVFTEASRFSSGEFYSAQLRDSGWSIEKGRGGYAEGKYVFTRYSSGWDELHVGSSAVGLDHQKVAYGMGYLEGALTQSVIYDSWRTGLNGTKSQFPQKFVDFVKTNMEWMELQVSTNKDEYWTKIGLVLMQTRGILEGYNSVAPADQKMSLEQFTYLQLGTESGDIMTALGLTHPKAEMMSATHHKPYLLSSHCSSLIKVTENDLFVSHDTWTDYFQMLRMYKFFNFTVFGDHTVHYSGYPGLIPSGDDYYTTGQNLVIMETTNDVMNKDLFKKVTTQTVPYWLRVTVSTMLATTAPEWVKYFSLYNSGTYNNQWMVIDYKLYQAGRPLVPNTLWVAEQIPGLVQSADVTSVLVAKGYWASYNIPFFTNVYDLSGYPAYFNKYGDSWSYTKCARAQIFKRDHSSVKDMASMMKIMRYNEWQTDPLSLKDSCRGISARCDLNTPWANNTLNAYSAFGAIDCKITSDTLMKDQSSMAISGPTYDSQPVFAWTNQWKYVPHWSQPDVFDFEFVSMKSDV